MGIIREGNNGNSFYVIEVISRDDNACISSLVSGFVGFGLKFENIIISVPYEGRRRILFVLDRKKAVFEDKSILDILRENPCVIDAQSTVLSPSIVGCLDDFFSKLLYGYPALLVNLDVIREVYLQLIRTFSPTNAKLILRVMGRESGKVAAKHFVERYGGKRDVGEIREFLSFTYRESGRGFLESIIWNGERYVLKFDYVWEKKVIDNIGGLMERLNFEEGFIEGFFSQLFESNFYCEYNVRREPFGEKLVFTVKKGKS